MVTRKRDGPAQGASRDRAARQPARATAADRRGYVSSATKSTGIVQPLVFGDEVVAERATRFPDLRWNAEHIDALAAKLVLQPQRFPVIVAPNVLSDLAAAVAGSIGIALSANLDPTRTCPSMFEPVHSSVPDIAGRGLGC